MEQTAQKSIEALLFGSRTSERTKVKNDYIGVFTECELCEQVVIRSQMGYHMSIFHGSEK